jgi:hypothetical protein
MNELPEPEPVEEEFELELGLLADVVDELAEELLLLALLESLDALPTDWPTEPEIEATVPLIGAVSRVCRSASLALRTLRRACSTLALAEAMLLAEEEELSEEEPLELLGVVCVVVVSGEPAPWVAVDWPWVEPFPPC